MDNDFGISLEDAVEEIGTAVENAHEFMVSEFSTDWDMSERYYAGKCDLPTETGRSTMVKTEARDVIRAIMPNVMRILLQSQKPVEYMPSSIQSAAFAEQQALWVNHQFMNEGGYDALFAATLESMKLKSGPIKAVWDENPAPEHFRSTGLSREQVVAFQDEDDIVVDEVEERSLMSGEVVYDITATRYYENGKTRFEAFPMYEFFVCREASDLTGVHGHRRSVKVSEAIEMGLEYDSWRDLDDNNPRHNDAISADTERRGYNPNDGHPELPDLMNHEFLLSETYCAIDLDGDGVPEKYVFYFGGTDYKYLHHEPIEDFCIAIVSVDPQPFTVVGRSIIDLTKQSQDNETSILRTIVDNAHQANNPRPAADPQRVNFGDLMNNAIGAPIRTKGRPEIQYAETPFTAGALIPFLEWMEKDAEMRVGVTKAARGMDPDAMQSTDKDAVMNTIQLSQGQIELIVRNIVNTGLIPLFKMALRLATRHLDKAQILRYKGKVVPVDIANFDPDLAAIPNVGLGTASHEQKIATLQFIYGQQKEYMMQFGMDNPFTSLSQIYNTLEDMVEMGGITNVGRYFNYIDTKAEEVIAKGMAEAAAKQAEAQQANQPLDPGKALIMTESMKSRVKEMEILNDRVTKLTDSMHKAIAEADEMDYKRDKMAQDRVVALREINAGELNDDIKREQDASKPKQPNTAIAGESPKSGQQAG